MLHRLALRIAVLLLATATVTACGATVTPSPTTPTPAPTPPGPTSVPTTTATLPPFDCGQAVSRPGTVPLARITGFAVENEAGIGRITFTFRPSGNVAAIPEVQVRPAAPPFTKDPSGLPLDVAGTAFVTITLQGGTALDDDFVPTYEGPFDATPSGSPIVDVRRAGDFEAVSSWVVGLDGAPCVRILPPDGSGRLVIELSAA